MGAPNRDIRINFKSLADVTRAFMQLRWWITKSHEHKYETVDPLLIDGNETNFSTANKYRSGTLKVFKNGVMQTVSSQYTVDSDLTGYTFVKAPRSRDKIFHEYEVGYF